MEWSFPWGGCWGGPTPEIKDNATVAIDRLPKITRECTGVPTLAKVFADRWQQLEYFIASVQPGDLWNISTASGFWLDQIGAYLDLPRNGRSDEYYRRVLSAYALIVYPRRRTIPGLIAALEEIGGAGNVNYTPGYPMCFTIDVAGTVLGSYEARDIAAIIRLGTPAAYCGYLVEQVDDPFQWGDPTGNVPVTNGWWSDANDPQLVTGVTFGKWSSVSGI